MGKNFDSYFEELLRERIDEMPCPTKAEVWQQIKKRLEDKQEADIIQLNNIRRINQKKRCVFPNNFPKYIFCKIATFLTLIVSNIIGGKNYSLNKQRR